MNKKTFYFSVALSFFVGAAVSSFTLANVADKPAPNTLVVEQTPTNLALQQKEIESRLKDLQKSLQYLVDTNAPCDCDNTEYNPYPIDPENEGW